MTFFYDRFWFEPGSRLTGVWLWPWPGGDSGEWVALVSHVRLGSGQDGGLESDFLCSHLPWAFGGFHGVGPGGDPWLVVIQAAPARAARELAGSENRWWPMVDGLDRALRWSGEADVASDLGLTRDGLVSIYVDTGIDRTTVDDWPVADLLAGLLAECAYVPLARIVTGRLTGCAFPDVEHDCEHDVFRDVFAAWALGRIAVPEAGDEPGQPEQDFADPSAPFAGVAVPQRNAGGKRWKKKVQGWPTARLRLLAVELGWSAKKASKADREALTAFLTTPRKQGMRRNLAPDGGGPGKMPPGGRTRMEQGPVRRLQLEGRHAMLSADWVVVATWAGAALYIGKCDYGDGDETTCGFDIDDPVALLAWMVADRFGHDQAGLEEYAERVGITAVRGQRAGRSATRDSEVAVELSAAGATVAFADWQRETTVDIDDWQGLTLLMLADRCQGPGAWSRVQQLAEQAGVATTSRDRGYV